MKNKGLLLTILITVAFLLVYYSYQLINANHLNYAQWGDGYKNYYTISYYLKYDHGAHFTGMNYPYGENVVFCDAQPVIVWILKPLVHLFPSIANYIHGYLAFSIFLSVVISAMLIYATLRQFNVVELQAAVFSALIAMMAPQLVRIMGHFALGYSFFLPLLFYLLVRYFKTQGSLKFAIAISGTLSFFAFIHIYCLGMGAMFVALIALVYTLINWRRFNETLRFTSPLLVVIVIPFILLKGYLILTDPINDRPHSPWGFVDSRSTVADILLNHNSFLGEEIERLFPKAHIVYHFEGMGYIGVIAIVVLLSIIILTVAKYSTIKQLNQRYYLNIFLLAGIAVLLFAMAFPFSITGLETYYDYMPAPVKQFRASGRFNWVFYYTATIYSAVLIHHFYHYLVSKGKRMWGIALIVSVFSVWFIEMNMIANRYGRDFKSVSNEIDEKAESNAVLSGLQKAGKSPGDFQAILAFPFFLNGSEKIYLDAPASFYAMKVSLFTGLPMVDTKLSRSSESQTFKIVDLLSSDYLSKDVLKLYPNNKPLLLMATDNDFRPIEKTLIDKAHFLFALDNSRYYELPLAAFADSTAQVKQNFVASKAILFQHGEYSSNNSVNNVIIRRFEDEPKNYAIFGSGAHYADNETAIFYFDTLPNVEKNEIPYETSYWTYSDERRAAFPVLYMTQMDSSGREIEKYETNPKFSTNAYGKWMRGEINFTLHNKKNKIYIVGKDHYATFDEVMVRPKNVTVYTGVVNDSTFMYNNWPIK